MIKKGHTKNPLCVLRRIVQCPSVFYRTRTRTSWADKAQLSTRKRTNCAHYALQTPRLYIQHTASPPPQLTRPNPHRPVSPPLNQIPILDPHSLNHTLPTLLLHRTRPTIPMPPISLIIDLDHILACSGHNAARVEHHAGDGVVVGVRVVDGAGAEIPDLTIQLAVV